MLLPSDREMFDDVCCGSFETPIDKASRLRFSSKVVCLLKKHKITSLLRFPDVTGKGVILCPPESREFYEETVKSYLSNNDDKSYFKYFVLEPGKFDRKGRIMLTAACKIHAEISANDVIVVSGVGPWFGVQKFDEWQQFMQCKTVA